MNGYFSQLMQQTGISLSNRERTQATVASTEGDRQTLIQGNIASPSPLEVETTQRVAAPLEESGGTLETSSAASADMLRPVEPESSLRSPPQPHSFLPNLNAPLEPLEAQRFEQVDEVQPLVEPLPPMSSIPPIAAIELAVDWQTPSTDLQLPQPNSPLEKLDELRVAAERSPESSPSSQPPTLTRQAYLQAALDWVAGNPQSAAQQIQGLEQLSEIPTPWNPESLQQRKSQIGLETIADSKPRTSSPNPLQEETQWQNTQPQTQELILSIGTISVTLETSPAAPAAPPPPFLPSRSANPPGNSPTSSRLNRHYLRLS